MRRRNWSVEEKTAVVLEGIKGQSTVAEICRKYQISQSQYYKWRDKFLEGGRTSLAGRNTNNDNPAKKLEHLHKIIGKQAIQIEILKKTEGLI